MKRKLLTRFFLYGIFTSATILSTINAQNSETRPIPDIITQVRVSSGIDLYVTQGDKISLEIEAEKDIMGKIITEVKGHELRIYTNTHFNWKRTTIPKVHLTINQIDRIVCSSGADVYTKNVIKTDSLELVAKSGADLYATVGTKFLKLSSSSGSDIKVKGKTVSLIAHADSGSDIIAEDLAAKYVKVSTSSGSDAKVYALESIDAHASSGSDVIYYGNPITRNIKKSSGGDVTQK
jgi:hypothetical protein